MFLRQCHCLCITTSLTRGDEQYLCVRCSGVIVAALSSAATTASGALYNHRHHHHHHHCVMCCTSSLGSSLERVNGEGGAHVRSFSKSLNTFHGLQSFMVLRCGPHL